MIKQLVKVMGSCLIIVLLLVGCAKANNSSEEDMQNISSSQEAQTQEIAKDEIEEDTEDKTEEDTKEETKMIEVNWEKEFAGYQGAAVFYDPIDNEYQIYNSELANASNSPCSTFKIISSLIGLESGVISSADSTRKWSGEIFWNDKWNQDINFEDAFRASCVWYYREVIDEIGKEMMQNELDKLQYGNRDISDWGGRLNTNNGNPVLTGFWIESSLKISPKEQTEVMERIFGEHTLYKTESLNKLKNAMLVLDEKNKDNNIYGKTGSGNKKGKTVDAWFTGFVEKETKKIYYCVYLGETDGMEISSAKAKEIALHLINEYFE